VREAFSAVVATAAPKPKDVSALFDVFLAGLVYPGLTREPDGARAAIGPLVRVIEKALRPD
jgi:hypothetical protein